MFQPHSTKKILSFPSKRTQYIWFKLKDFLKIIKVLFNLPQLRVLDGVHITAEELVKSENFYGLELDERKQIFKKTFEEEDFVDRRINFIELVDPESESDDDEINFIDQYDNDGRVVTKMMNKSKSKQASQSHLSESSSRLKEI